MSGRFVRSSKYRELLLPSFSPLLHVGLTGYPLYL